VQLPQSHCFTFSGLDLARKYARKLSIAMLKFHACSQVEKYLAKM